MGASRRFVAVTTARTTGGRFSSGWRLWELPELVEQLARLVRPDAPEDLTRAQYDRERGSAGWSHVPTSKAVLARLAVPTWTQLTAFPGTAQERAVRNRLLSRWLEAPHTRGCTTREVIEALLLVARHLERDSLRRGEYAEARWELLQCAKRSGASRLSLPTSSQISRHVNGEWGRALRLAGLRSTIDAQDTVYELGLTSVDVLDACITVHDAVPTPAEAERFATINGLRLRRESPQPSEAERYPLVVRRRARRGLTTPQPLTRGQPRPLFNVRVDPERIPKQYRVPAFHQTLHRPLRPEHYVQAVSAFLEQLPSGLPTTESLYREFTKREPRLPSAEVMAAHGGFANLRDQAVRDRVAARRSTD